jgi:hypothetical protein
VDETGWRIGGKTAWLWDFVTEELTLYAIEFSRGHEVPQTEDPGRGFRRGAGQRLLPGLRSTIRCRIESRRILFIY